jgi:hypothetical protein
MRETFQDTERAWKGTDGGDSAVGLGQRPVPFSFACSLEDEGDAPPRRFLCRVEMSSCDARYCRFI